MNTIHVWDYSVDEEIEIDKRDINQIIESDNPDHILLENMDGLFYEVSVSDATANGLID